MWFVIELGPNESDGTTNRYTGARIVLIFTVSHCNLSSYLIHTIIYCHSPACKKTKCI